jgi:hypothetical protein
MLVFQRIAIKHLWMLKIVISIQRCPIEKASSVIEFLNRPFSNSIIQTKFQFQFNIFVSNQIIEQFKQLYFSISNQQTFWNTILILKPIQHTLIIVKFGY